MNQLKLGTRDNQKVFRPRDEISGGAGWQLDKPARVIEVRLFWYTRGKGTEDSHVFDTVRFEDPPQEGAQPFCFTGPAMPYSFSGKLVSTFT